MSKNIRYYNTATSYPPNAYMTNDGTVYFYPNIPVIPLGQSIPVHFLNAELAMQFMQHNHYRYYNSQITVPPPPASPVEIETPRVEPDIPREHSPELGIETEEIKPIKHREKAKKKKKKKPVEPVLEIVDEREVREEVEEYIDTHIITELSSDSEHETTFVRERKKKTPIQTPKKKKLPQKVDKAEKQRIKEEKKKKEESDLEEFKKLPVKKPTKITQVQKPTKVEVKEERDQVITKNDYEAIRMEVLFDYLRKDEAKNVFYACLQHVTKQANSRVVVWHIKRSPIITTSEIKGQADSGEYLTDIQSASDIIGLRPIQLDDRKYLRVMPFDKFDEKDVIVHIKDQSNNWDQHIVRDLYTYKNKSD